MKGFLLSSYTEKPWKRTWGENKTAYYFIFRNKLQHNKSQSNKNYSVLERIGTRIFEEKKNSVICGEISIISVSIITQSLPLLKYFHSFTK